jgi:hypothetical protein
MKIKDTTRRERTILAKKMRVALGTLDHIASGIRQPSADMARRIEEATIKLGWPVITRESLCRACGKCELAKRARKADVKEEKIW